MTTVEFKITEATRAEHLANSNSDDMSAGGEVIVNGSLRLIFCIYKGELAWMTFADDPNGAEVKDQQLIDTVYAEWCGQYL
jgi:hypothetical protein